MSTKHKQITIADFKAYKPDGSLHPDIVKAFLVRQSLDSFDILSGKVKISDYDDLTLICDDDVKDAIRLKNSVECIISVQFRTQGHYALAKLLKRNSDNA